MESYTCRILGIENVTHDVKHFTVERPEGYAFVPGQATEVAINKPGWENERRPFTFTGLNDAPHLEFVIKIYPQHEGVTNQLNQLKKGDALLLHDVWGAIQYKGPGVFIAGGAGITPFLAILRQLHKEHRIEGNTLLFSNKTSRDIILNNELEKMMGRNFVKILTEEAVPGVHSQRIDKAYLKQTVKNFNQHFYICGPEKFTESISALLVELGAKADAVVFEK